MAMLRWQKDVAWFTTSYQEEFVSGLFPGAPVGPAEIYLLLRDSATIYIKWRTTKLPRTTVHPSKLIGITPDTEHIGVSQGVGQIARGSSTHLCTEAAGETPSILPGGSPPSRASPLLLSTRPETDPGDVASTQKGLPLTLQELLPTGKPPHTQA